MDYPQKIEFQKMIIDPENYPAATLVYHLAGMIAFMGIQYARWRPDINPGNTPDDIINQSVKLDEIQLACQELYDILPYYINLYAALPNIADIQTQNKALADFIQNPLFNENIQKARELRSFYEQLKAKYDSNLWLQLGGEPEADLSKFENAWAGWKMHGQDYQQHQAYQDIDRKIEKVRNQRNAIVQDMNDLMACYLLDQDPGAEIQAPNRARYEAFVSAHPNGSSTPVDWGCQVFDELCRDDPRPDPKSLWDEQAAYGNLIGADPINEFLRTEQGLLRETEDYIQRITNSYQSRVPANASVQDQVSKELGKNDYRGLTQSVYNAVRSGRYELDATSTLARYENWLGINVNYYPNDVEAPASERFPGDEVDEFQRRVGLVNQWLQTLNSWEQITEFLDHSFPIIYDKFSILSISKETSTVFGWIKETHRQQGNIQPPQPGTPHSQSRVREWNKRASIIHYLIEWLQIASREAAILGNEKANHDKAKLEYDIAYGDWLRKIKLPWYKKLGQKDQILQARLKKENMVCGICWCAPMDASYRQSNQMDCQHTDVPENNVCNKFKGE